MPSSADHFEGKSAEEHLKQARQKGATASEAIHGIELPGYTHAAIDSARETVLVQLLLIVAGRLLFPESTLTQFLLLFSIGWSLWKGGRSTLIGWQRMGRLHRLIEEERWEIEHHRGQEREELTALYQLKGLEGRLLEEVVDVLMADDNRLLQVMLEEELGVSLHNCEHPLKQGVGAFVAAAISSSLMWSSLQLFPLVGPLVCAPLIFILTTHYSSKRENHRSLHAIIWALSVATLSLGVVYFLGEGLGQK